MTTVLTEAAGGGMMYSTLIWVVAMIAIVYFLMIRPQKKEQNRMNAMLSQSTLSRQNRNEGSMKALNFSS